MPKKDLIEVSPKHGLNPCLVQCFWCGNEANEIALFGRLPDDAKAPLQTVVSYDPCDKCLKQWNDTIILIEVSKIPSFPLQPAIHKNNNTNLYPTGNIVGITEKIAESIGTYLKRGQTALINEDAFRELTHDSGKPVPEWITPEQNISAEEYLTVIFKNIKQHGYTGYINKNSDYGFIITPHNNILYVQLYPAAGWNFNLQYKPSKDNGTGCQCLEDCVPELTLSVIKQAEIEGLEFARKLKPEFYKSPEQWFESYWNKNNLEKI